MYSIGYGLKSCLTKQNYFGTNVIMKHNNGYSDSDLKAYSLEALKM